MPLGPVQLLVVGFDRPDFRGEVLAELERLRVGDVVRVIDLLVVYKGADGVVQRVRDSELTAGEADGVGAVVGALIGLGATGEEGADARALGGARRDEADGGHLLAEEGFWSLDEAIANDSAAAIALVEHRWAIGLRDAIRAAGGVPVADAWIHPADLVAAGLIDAEDAAAPDG
jgi:uncharacterized membrane protein